MIITAKIGRRGQITLPKEIRERLHLDEGQQLAFAIKNGEITLQPLTSSLQDHRGAIKVTEAQDFEQIRQNVKQIKTKRLAKD